MNDFFEQMAEGGTPRPETAEVKLDLSPEDEAAALQKLGHVLTYCRKSGAASLYVSFPPAQPGAGTSLFQPVARAIAAAKSRGEVVQAIPLIRPDAAGIYVRMAQG